MVRANRPLKMDRFRKVDGCRINSKGLNEWTEVFVHL